jgi:hypothetical protein
MLNVKIEIMQLLALVCLNSLGIHILNVNQNALQIQNVLIIRLACETNVEIHARECVDHLLLVEPKDISLHAHVILDIQETLLDSAQE